MCREPRLALLDRRGWHASVCCHRHSRQSGSLALSGPFARRQTSAHRVCSTSVFPDVRRHPAPPAFLSRSFEELMARASELGIPTRHDYTDLNGTVARLVLRFSRPFHTPLAASTLAQRSRPFSLASPQHLASSIAAIPDPLSTTWPTQPNSRSSCLKFSLGSQRPDLCPMLRFEGDVEIFFVRMRSSTS